MPGAEKVRLAIVGCGAIAEEMHAPAAVSLDDVELVALVDTDLERAGGLADQFAGVKTARSIGEVADDISAVILATPPHVRPQLAEEAFSLGLHVFCEKPLANTVSECERITDAAGRAGRVLAVGHLYRFWPSRAGIRDLLSQNGLGKIRSVTVEQGKPYSWQPVSGYTFRRDMVSGGVLLNAGIHLLDSLLWWLGDPVDLTYEDDSLGGLESNVRLAAQFTGDVSGELRLSRTCNLTNEICIEGEDATLTTAVNSVTTYWLSRDGAKRLCRCADDTDEYPPHARDQLSDFVASVISGRPPRVSGMEGTRVIRLVEDCYAQKRARPLPLRAPSPGMTW